MHACVRVRVCVRARARVYVRMFGLPGAAKDGTMCNDAFALDIKTWEWRVLAADSAQRPSPRAGARAYYT